MKIHVVFFSLLLSLSSWAQSQSPSPRSLLSIQDQKIYDETVAQCKSGSTLSAFKIGFNAKAYAQSVEGWMSLIHFKSAVRDERKSNGFWLALTQCYGYHYGVLNYGNLMKQIIDVGHLTTEVAALLTAGSATITSAKYLQLLWTKFPLASQFLAAGTISLKTQNFITAYFDLYGTELTEQDKKDLQNVQSKIFSKPDEAISQAQIFAENKLLELKRQYQNPNLTESERQTIAIRIQKIQIALDKLNQELKNN